MVKMKPEGRDNYYQLCEITMRDGKWRSCGVNLRHDCRWDAEKKMYELALYVPCYGVAKRKYYKTLAGVKAAITRWDNQ